MANSLATKPPYFLPCCWTYAATQGSTLRGQNFRRFEVDPSSPQAQIALTNRAQVARPVGVATWSHQVTPSLVLEWQHRHCVRATAGAAPDCQAWRQPQLRQQRVHNLIVEKARLPVRSRLTHESDCSKSASKSSGCSSPTEQRIRPSLIPALARSVGSNPRCEVDAGWLSVVATLPRLGISRTS